MTMTVIEVDGFGEAALQEAIKALVPSLEATYDRRGRFCRGSVIQKGANYDNPDVLSRPTSKALKWTTPRSWHALERAGFNVIGDIVECIKRGDFYHLVAVRNFGEKGVRDLLDGLRIHDVADVHIVHIEVRED